jgi:hypothetical protein
MSESSVGQCVGVILGSHGLKVLHLCVVLQVRFLTQGSRLGGSGFKVRRVRFQGQAVQVSGQVGQGQGLRLGGSRF